MSDSSMVSRLARRTAVDSQEVELEEPVSFGCFGLLRGVRERALMLELRKRSGDILAIGYGWIERMAYDPSRGISLHVPGLSIRIEGRFLNEGEQPLFQALTRHRVPWLCESERTEAHEERRLCQIETLTW